MDRSSLSYPYEKFSSAVSTLATSARDIRSRLYSAALSLITLQSKDFADHPEIMRGFDELFRELTSVEAIANEGQIQATLATKSDDEAAAIASKIVDLFFHILREYKEV